MNFFVLFPTDIHRIHLVLWEGNALCVSAILQALIAFQNNLKTPNIREVRVLLISQRCGETSALMSSWTYDGFTRKVFWAISVCFSCSKAEKSEVGTTVSIILCLTIILCILLAYIG